MNLCYVTLGVGVPQQTSLDHTCCASAEASVLYLLRLSAHL